MDQSDIAMAAIELIRNELNNTIQTLQFRQSLGVEPDEDETIAMAIEKFFTPALEQIETWKQVLTVLKHLEEGE
jgi:hypothetical protein